MSAGRSERSGFFIPYRYASSVVPCAYPVMEPIFRAAEPVMLELMGEAELLADRFQAMKGPPPLPRFDQEWFARLDAVGAYSFVISGKPRRIIEIGSGHSTRFIACAIADGGLATELLCIDPSPRAAIAELPVRHDPRRLEDLDAAELASLLAPGDILFVDSSHLLVPGCDVDRIVNDLMPRLQRGVIVHIHDIFLPDAYPSNWAWRGYAEQNVVAPLIHTGAWQLLWSSHWLATRCATRVAQGPLASLPLLPDVLETSVWLTRA